MNPLFWYSQELQDDIIEHAPNYQSVISSAENLLKSCDSNKVVVDVAQVRDEKLDVVDRWDKLGLDVNEMTKKIDNLRKAVGDYEKRLAPVEEVMVAVERKLDEEQPMSWDMLEMETYVNDLNVSTFLQGAYH